MKARTAYISVQ